MTSRYLNENLEYTHNLSRPGTALGSVLASDVNGDFIPIAPTADFQVLTSDSTQAAGVEWKASSTNTGLAFAQNGLPFSGSPIFYLIDFNMSGPVPLVLPNSKAVFISINCKDPVNGWCDDNSRFNGGSYDLTVGYTPANTNNTLANWIAYPGGPHLSISFLSIKANNFASFTAGLNITISEGQQFSIIKRNTLTVTNGPPLNFGSHNAFLLCVGI